MPTQDVSGSDPFNFDDMGTHLVRASLVYVYPRATVVTSRKEEGAFTQHLPPYFRGHASSRLLGLSQSVCMFVRKSGSPLVNAPN